jgi:DNA-binding phage protein
MKAAGLPVEFVSSAMQLALQNEGALDLMELWIEEVDEVERGRIEADFQELIDDIREAPNGHLQKPKINYKELDAVAAQVMEHKVRLRALVEKHGGVSAVARQAGIPQPSLSRMLNSAVMPRRSTLWKIARALDVSESEIIGEWVR